MLVSRSDVTMIAVDLKTLFAICIFSLVAETRILAPLAAVPAFASRSEATSRNRGLNDAFSHLHFPIALYGGAFASRSEALNPSRGLQPTEISDPVGRVA
jgi:hypothetical protein